MKISLYLISFLVSIIAFGQENLNIYPYNLEVNTESIATMKILGKKKILIKGSEKSKLKIERVTNDTLSLDGKYFIEGSDTVHVKLFKKKRQLWIKVKNDILRVQFKSKLKPNPAGNLWLNGIRILHPNLSFSLLRAYTVAQGRGMGVL